MCRLGFIFWGVYGAKAFKVKRVHTSTSTARISLRTEQSTLFMVLGGDCRSLYP